VAVASVASVVAGVPTFFVTRHPVLALKAGADTFATVGGVVLQSYIVINAVVAVE
jgi:hypothetical protein